MLYVSAEETSVSSPVLWHQNWNFACGAHKDKNGHSKNSSAVPLTENHDPLIQDNTHTLTIGTFIPWYNGTRWSFARRAERDKYKPLKKLNRSVSFQKSRPGYWRGHTQIAAGGFLKELRFSRISTQNEVCEREAANLANRTVIEVYITTLSQWRANDLWAVVRFLQCS